MYRNVHLTVFIRGHFEADNGTRERLQDTLGYSSFRKIRKCALFAPICHHKYPYKHFNQQICIPNGKKRLFPVKISANN